MVGGVEIGGVGVGGGWGRGVGIGVSVEGGRVGELVSGELRSEVCGRGGQGRRSWGRVGCAQESWCRRIGAPDRDTILLPTLPCTPILFHTSPHPPPPLTLPPLQHPSHIPPYTPNTFPHTPNTLPHTYHPSPVMGTINLSVLKR